jgi:hypothetical protein
MAVAGFIAWWSVRGPVVDTVLSFRVVVFSTR